jgi:hypothetical protein
MGYRQRQEVTEICKGTRRRGASTKLKIFATENLESHLIAYLEAGPWAKVSSQYQNLGDNPVVTLNRFETPITKPESGCKIHGLLRLSGFRRDECTEIAS